MNVNLHLNLHIHIHNYLAWRASFASIHVCHRKETKSTDTLSAFADFTRVKRIPFRNPELISDDFI